MRLPNLPRDLNGNPISNPSEQFAITDWTDDTANPIYIGSVDIFGKWQIKKVDTTARTVLFAVGSSDYATAWAGRAGLTYTSIDVAYTDGVY